MNNEANVNNINLCIAEVIDSTPLTTYSWKQGSKKDGGNSYNLFEVTARIDGYVNKPLIFAKPANTSIKKVPVIGEMILAFQLNSSKPKSDTYDPNQWYYLSTVDIVSSVNHNVLTGYTSNEEKQQQVGKSFPEKTISPLQPYQGDVLMEGRFGNSIRLGNSVQGGSLYTLQQQSKFTGGSPGDPILIISNGRQNKPAKEFVHEDIKLDQSSLYLTSTQAITGLNLNHPLRKGSPAPSYSKSQFIGVADRIILHAKNDIIALDAKTGIEINSNDIRFGTSDSKEPMLHSSAVIELLNLIVTTINCGFQDSSGVMCTPFSKDLQNTSTISKLFKQCLNKRMLTDTYKE